MKEKNTLIICGMICITLIIAGILFWPTIYRYDSIKDGNTTINIRVNLITGTTETFGPLERPGPLGWRKPFNIEDYEPPKLLLPEERAKLIDEIQDPYYEDANAPLPKGTYVCLPQNDFSLSTQIYNGTEHYINALLLIIEAKNKDGTTRWKRKYEAMLNGTIKPFSSGLVGVKPSDSYGVAVYIWTIDGAWK